MIDLGPPNLEVERYKKLRTKKQHAQKMVDQKIDEIKRAVTSIRLWQKRVAYYEREQGVTLAQKRIQREANIAKRRVRVRKIAL